MRLKKVSLLFNIELAHPNSYHIGMFSEKSSSVLTMSQDFTTNLLESIRKSEATTIEKQRRIQDCLEAIGELSASAQASENACRNLKQEIDDAKDRIAGKRAEKDLDSMKLEVTQGQIEVLKTEVKKAKEKSLEEAENMTAIVDKVSEEAQNMISKEDDVVGGVIENQNSQLISDFHCTIVT